MLCPKGENGATIQNPSPPKPPDGGERSNLTKLFFRDKLEGFATSFAIERSG